MERDREREFYFFIYFFAYFLDIRKLDRRFSLRLNAKLIHAARATHGTKILEFRQTPRDREFSYLCYFKSKGHLMV